MYVYTLHGSRKYSMELVTNRSPPVPELQGLDLACMSQLNRELNRVEKK